MGGQHLVALARLGGGWRRVRTKGADVRRGMDSGRDEPVPARANSRFLEAGWRSVGHYDHSRKKGMESAARPEGWRPVRVAGIVPRPAVPVRRVRMKESEAKRELIRLRPGAVAVRLNKEDGEWNVWAGSWTGAQFLGRGTTEEEAWSNALRTTKEKRRTRRVCCRSCFISIEIDEDADHPNVCDGCRRERTAREKAMR